MKRVLECLCNSYGKSVLLCAHSNVVRAIQVYNIILTANLIKNRMNNVEVFMSIFVTAKKNDALSPESW